MRAKTNEETDFYTGLFIIAMALLSVAAWFTHIIVCLDEEKWGFLIGGAILVPIAVVHGVGIWFGFF